MGREEKHMEQLILEAAEKLFLEQGFEKTTTGQIANVAGCNQALVHYYYRTKNNLFDRIFEEKIRMVASRLLSIGLDGITIEEKVTQIICTHFEVFRENPRLAPFLIKEVLSDPDKFDYLIEKLKHYPESVLLQLDKDLEESAGKGLIRPARAADLMLTIMSLNITPFLLKPMLQKGLDIPEEEFQKILEHRKQETITTVLARLKV